MIIRFLTVNKGAFSPCRCSPPLLGRVILCTIGLMSLSCVNWSVLSVPTDKNSLQSVVEVDPYVWLALFSMRGHQL